MKFKTLLFILGLSFCFIGQITAGPEFFPFFDSFDSENIGLDYNSFANWDVVGDGTVDLIGVGSDWDYFPAYGRYVDLDGSTFKAGKIITKNEFTLNPGIYELSFELGGNQRPGYPADQIIVRVGTLLNETFSLSTYDPFQTYTRTIEVNSIMAGVKLSFEGVGSDNVGILLDNVKFTANPEPGTFILFGSGLIGLFLFRWKQHKKY